MAKIWKKLRWSQDSPWNFEQVGCEQDWSGYRTGHLVPILCKAVLLIEIYCQFKSTFIRYSRENSTRMILCLALSFTCRPHMLRTAVFLRQYQTDVAQHDYYWNFPWCCHLKPWVGGIALAFIYPWENLLSFCSALKTFKKPFIFLLHK